MKKLKRLLSFAIMLTVTASFLSVPVKASASNDFVVENGVLTAYNGPGGDVVIPVDMGITAISNAFYQNKNISSVTIPNGVTAIKSEAFSYCSLAAVTIPKL